MVKNSKIAVIGLGKLGLPLATILGSEFNTIGIDKDITLISKLKQGIIPYKEQMLKEYFKNSHNLRLTYDFKDLRYCDVFFCIVPTPSKANGEFTNKYIEDALKELNPYLTEDKIFVIVSTVMPGSTRKLQKTTKAKLVYNPEFIQIGNVLKGIEEPDFVLIGSDDEKSGKKVEKIYRRILLYTQIPIIHASTVEAEISKIALNSYVTMKISFANVLGEISEYYKANVDNITNAIGTDRRIGKKFLKSGTAFGGPCFPRDNKAFGKVLEKANVKGFNELTDCINSRQTARLLSKCKEILKNLKNKKISIIGMGYSINTPLRIESPSEWLKSALEANSVKVLEDAIDNNTDLIVVMLPNQEIIKTNVDFINKHKIKVLDCWRSIYKIDGKNYHKLGVGK